MQRLPFLPYTERLRFDAVARPWYGWSVYNAALQARALGIPAVGVVEFGVAGGLGLLCLESHAKEVELATGIKVSLYGFDAGSGLPESDDFRDLPYSWQPGSFEMDFDALSRRLRRAKLIIGDVRHTLEDFIRDGEFHPLGALMFDLDYYSSTTAALQILEVPADKILPRAFCYFDDIVGYPENLYCEQTGVRLAINEFNRRRNGEIHLSPVNAFKGRMPEYWHDQIYACHRFTHAHYNRCLSSAKGRLNL
jgi:hypothetical protein